MRLTRPGASDSSVAARPKRRSNARTAASLSALMAWVSIGCAVPRAKSVHCVAFVEAHRYHKSRFTMARALEGLKVIECGVAGAAAYAGQLMGALGAGAVEI